MRVACIGEAMIELSMGDPPAVGVAGDTLNTAIYLKREAPGIEIDYVTRLGSDPFSDQIRAFIAAQNIGVSNIERSEAKIPGLYAITTKDGERSFTYWRDNAAARDLFQTPDGPDFSGLDAYDLIYLSGITLAILPPHIRDGLLEYLQSRDVRFAFDSNYRPRLWENASTARDALGSYWNRADIALPSVDDEMALFDETQTQVEARFLSLGRLGALKRGADGPLALGGSVPDQSYPPAPQIVDTTAAGDSFNGAFLAACLTGKSHAKALMAGHGCAAWVVQHRGAIVPFR